MPQVQSTEASPRARLVLVAGAAALLAAVVVGVTLAGGGSDPSVRALPPGCVRAWNADPAAASYGRHNFDSHGYRGALVTYLSSSAERLDEGGVCAVIFASQALDPEPFAAGQVLSEGRWLPISSLDGVELTAIAELQASAAGDPNVTLEPDGRLADLEG